MPSRRPSLSINHRGSDVEKLHRRLRKLGRELPEAELKARRFGPGTREVIAELQDRYRLPRTGELDVATEVVLDSASRDADSDKHRVDGFLVLENGAPAPEGVIVRLYKKAFGKRVKVAEEKTREQGFYALNYEADEANNLEIVAVDAEGEEVTLSKTKFDPKAHEVMNLVAPVDVLEKPDKSEYARLLDGLEEHLGESALVDAREDDELNDVTYLANASGWDARLVALAVKAERLTKDDRLADVSSEALYGLLRAGLPSDPDRLTRMGSDVVQETLRKARETSLVDLNPAAIKVTTQTFRQLENDQALATRSPASVAAPGELLVQTGLERQAQEAFFELVRTHRDDPNALWESVEASDDIPTDQIDSLRVQGKLGHLTGNNPVLVRELQDAQIDSPDKLPELVDQEFHEAKTWLEVLKSAAPEAEDTARIIPAIYNGEDVDERLGAYAEDLARKVRISYPTRVLKKRVESGELALRGDEDSLRAQVAQFLDVADREHDVVFGATSLKRFVRDLDDGDRDALFGRGTPEEARTQTFEEVKRLQRLYQVTPDDDALKVLTDLGFDSAHEIDRLGYDVFQQMFLKRYLELIERGLIDRQLKAPAIHKIGELVYGKIRQVTTTTKTFFSTAKQLDTAPSVFALSPGDDDSRDEAKQKIGEAFPTMEGLFGSLDFCECEHCRSVLSPAAYLVDLLQFLDPSETTWEHFVEQWNDRGYERYPFKTQEELDGYTERHDEAPPSPGDLMPYDVLTARRPDLPHIGLTCENTHTQLPYIDVVNEIFEYYVANEKQLDEHAANDVDGADSADLLAEPQHVIARAYNTLKDENSVRYPLDLPFDLWTETLRQFMEHFGAPLPEVMESFRTSDGLTRADAGDDGHAYHWQDIFREQLGMTPGEWSLFTDDVHTEWHEFYGYADEASALGQLSSARTLARRLDVTYKELDALVDTRFVNPGFAQLTLAHKLGVRPEDIAAFNDGTMPELEREVLDERIGDLNDRYPDIDVRSEVDSATVDSIWTLYDDEPGCDFSRTALRQIGGGAVTDLVLLKLNLFVRLWKKLGWPIDEVDRVLCRFVPSAIEELSTETLHEQLETALIYLAHLKTLSERFSLGDGERVGLLTFWGDIGMVGAGSLYEQLFLRGDEESTTAFSHPLGEYLSADQDVVDHMAALQAAVGLAEEDIRLIIEHDDQVLESDDEATEPAKLTVPNVSLLYRHALLAEALDVSVPELLNLEALVEEQPLSELHAGKLEDIGDDRPFETLRFADIVERLEAAELDIADVDWLVRHRFDPLGAYRRDDQEVLSWLMGLRETLKAVDQDAGPDLDERKQQAVLDAVATRFDLEPSQADTLVATTDVLVDPEAESPQPLLPVFQTAADLPEDLPSDPPEEHDGTTRLLHAELLLSKVISLADLLGLSVRELKHVTAHPDDFGGLNLSSLPVVFDDGASTRERFKGLMSLVEYALLKRDLSSGSDDLLGVLETARSATDEDDVATLRESLYQKFGELTRREPASVRAAAEHLGFDITVDEDAEEDGFPATDFGRPGRLRRLWEVLQTATRLRVSVSTVARWTTPSPTAAIARQVRDAVESSHSPEAWRQVAQSVFDELRKKKRDALVSHLLHVMGLERREQLFEHFLIDPGMEPVVRTSRIRLALSSIQTFVQRCLLNLEELVDPSALNAEHWRWMKRYRVWEANRKIFLYPENWLEPELRDNKTHLFQEMESSLLEGDVSRDLVEDAFYTYLKKLEGIAKLEMVSMYAEEDPRDPASNVLHVIGRTHSHPHKYFYRRFSHQSWTPWEPVGVEIESDHIAAVVYRERLHLFWVNFQKKAVDKSSSSSKSVQDLADEPIGQQMEYTVEAQLSWTQYVDGEWTERRSTDFKHLPNAGRVIYRKGPMGTYLEFPAIHFSEFDPSDVSVHVTKNVEDGRESAVLIQLGWPINQAVKFVSRNAEPVVSSDINFYPHRYGTDSDPNYATNLGARDGILGVSYTVDREMFDEYVPTSKFEPILEHDQPYWLLPTENPGDDYDDQLVRPFFYQDDRRVFFVQPTVEETRVTEWDTWVWVEPKPVDPKVVAPWIYDEDFWKRVERAGKLPRRPLPDPVGPEIFDRIDESAVLPPNPDNDWISDAHIELDDHLIDGAGRVQDVSDQIYGGEAGMTQVALDSPALHSGQIIVGGDGLAGVSDGVSPGGGTHVVPTDLTDGHH